MGEMDEEDLPTMKDVNEAMKAFNYRKNARSIIVQIPSPVEERIMALGGYK